MPLQEQWNEHYKCMIPVVHRPFTVEEIREVLASDNRWLGSEFWEGAGYDIATFLVAELDKLETKGP